MCRQLSNYFDSIFSRSQCSFRNIYSPQHSLFFMIDKWKKAVDSNKVFGVAIINLSKAFDCICHELLIAKRNAYRLSLPASKLIKDYLQYRKQRTKLESPYSNWENITSGVPQGSILGPLFSISFYVTYFLKTKTMTLQIYAYDTPSYFVGSTTAGVLENLFCLTKKLCSWFANNQMIANDK